MIVWINYYSSIPLHWVHFYLVLCDWWVRKFMQTCTLLAGSDPQQRSTPAMNNQTDLTSNYAPKARRLPALLRQPQTTKSDKRSNRSHHLFRTQNDVRATLWWAVNPIVPPTFTPILWTSQPSVKRAPTTLQLLTSSDNQYTIHLCMDIEKVSAICLKHLFLTIVNGYHSGYCENIWI